MIRTSPSELVLRDDCGRAHEFKYRQKLRLKDEKRSPTLASGTAVHYVVETWCRDYSGIVPGGDDLEARGRECLIDEFKADEDGGGRNVKKFLPGVVRALKRVPAWVWQEEWYVETDVVGRFGRSQEGVAVVELHGRPDMWRLIDDEAPSVEIIDVKTTDHQQLDYVLWTPQIRMYAACLQQAMSDRLITYRYLCVPTGVRGEGAAETTLFVLTREAYDVTEIEILNYAKALGEPAQARYARRCAYCDYAPICTAIITGAEAAGITEELYIVKKKEE